MSTIRLLLVALCASALGAQEFLPGPNLTLTGALTLAETDQRLAFNANPDGGTPATTSLLNMALPVHGGMAFEIDRVSPTYGDDKLNNGVIGVGVPDVNDATRPWISADVVGGGYGGVKFATPIELGHVAFGSRFSGRSDGSFTIAYTTDSFAGVDLEIPQEISALNWTAIGTLTSTTSGEFGRHLFALQTPVKDVTGVLIDLERGSSITELEAYPVLLDNAIEGAHMTWSVNGTKGWTQQTAVTHDGVDAARSQDITHGEQTSLETTVVGPGTLHFWWKVSSEPGYDFLRFHVDDLESPQAPAISGQVDWQVRSVPVAAGSHVLRWTYSKDGSDDGGSDTAWLDEVSFSAPVNITTDEDDGNGLPTLGAGVSFREAIEYTPTGGTITFDPALSGATLVLTLSQLVIDKNLVIDASVLPGGVTLDLGSYRLPVAAGATVTLNALSLINGHGFGAYAPGGGAIYNEGNLHIIGATIRDNSGFSGGAIHNDTTGTLTLSQCLVCDNATTGNTAGGAIANLGDCVLNNTTLTGNQSDHIGGAIINYASGSVALNHVTMTDNHADAGGGGIVDYGTLTLTNSIIAGNQAPVSVQDIQELGGTITPTGVNLIGDLSGSTLVDDANVNVGLPLLDPLGDYGGRTSSMPPQPGSAEINTPGTLAILASDQRGAPRSDGVSDLGAVEYHTAVIATAADENDSPPGATLSLREALAAGYYSRITFDPAVFNGEAADIVRLLHGPLVFATSGRLDATNTPLGVTFDANHGSRVFEILPERSVEMHALTLTRGNAGAEDGGGILNAGTLLLTHSTIRGSRSDQSGGGIYSNGPLTLESVTLTGNSADNGAGLANRSTLTMTHSTVHGNRAGIRGGGIDNGGTLELFNVTISRNRAATQGGGIYHFSPFTLTNSIVSENHALEGSDIYQDFGSATALGLNLVGDLSGSDLVDDSNVNIGQPLLSPLGYYGGRVETLHPLSGSPAIDPAGSAPRAVATDSRGFPAQVGASVDVGAVETGPVILVNHIGDDDATATTLRQAISNATSPGQIIRFDPALFDGEPADTILNGLELSVPTGRSIFIDASGITGGVTIDSGGSNRIFQVSAGATLGVQSLTITGGSATAGGGIANDGTLTVNHSTFSGNSATHGGAISNVGPVILNHSTFTANSAQLGAGVLNVFGHLHVRNSTFAANTSTNFGGALYNNGPLTVTNATLSGNTATARGGGIFITGGFLELTDSVIANNASPLGPDIAQNDGTITPFGLNILTTLVGTVLVDDDHIDVADPLLSPLGDHGGPTETLRPLFGSPAINPAGTASGLPTDQRGRLRFDPTPDIGAVEFQEVVVTTAADENNSPAGALTSLREAIAEPFVEAVTFDPAVFNGQPGDTITLTNGQLLIDTDLLIDATSTPAGVIISGNNASRVFQIDPNHDVTLDSLTLTNGNADKGAGIWNDESKLTLRNSTLTGNHATGAGGGIYSDTALTGNSTTISNCTIANNSATVEGGGIHNYDGRLVLSHATVTGNSAPAGFGGGISSYGDAFTLAEVSASVISANTGTDADVTSGAFNSFTSSGANLLGTGNALAAFAQSNDLTGVTDPVLASLGNYGGLTPTMPPLPGSPAIDAPDTTDPGGTDQRAATRFLDGDGNGIPLLDRGSVEVSIAAEFAPLVTTPADGAIDVPPLPTINWTAPQIGTPDSYEIFIDHVLVDSATGTSFTLPTHLAPVTTFTLRVDALFGATRVTGADRTFTTRVALIVDTVADENDGLTIGAISLREAIAAATPNEVITFDPVLFNGEPGDTIVLTHGRLFIDQSLTIDASAIPGGVRIDANGAVTLHRVLEVDDPTTVLLDSLILTGGNTENPSSFLRPGGGIRNRGDLTLRRCVVTGNTTGSGADGVDGSNGSPGTSSSPDGGAGGHGTSGEYGGIGGGIFSSGSLTLTQSTISGNTTGNGGHGGNGGQGGYAYFQGLSGYTGNGGSGGNGRQGGSGGAGAGIFLSSSSTCLIEHTTITDNTTGTDGAGGTAGAGGFGIISGGTGSAGVSRASVGGGIHNSGTLTIIQATIANNAATEGGGIVSTYGNLSLANTIIGGNTGTSGPDLQTYPPPGLTGFNLIEDSSGSNITDFSQVIVAPPALRSLGDYGGPTPTMPPHPGSPALDAAGTSDPGGTDQRGFPRFLDGDGDAIAQLDIGAAEVDPALDFIGYAAAITSPAEGATGLSLRPAILWSAPSSGTPDHFEIFIDGVSAGTRTGLSFNVSPDLLPDTAYTVRVDAVYGPEVIPGIPQTFTTRVPATLVVDTATDENDGIGTGGVSLRDAVAAAVSGDHITFDPALFNGEPGDTIVLSNGQIVINKSLTIDATANSGALTIDAAGASRVWVIQSGHTVELRALTVQGGFGSGLGGAIYCNGSHLILANCTFQDNEAAFDGGAILMSFSPFTVTNCTFQGNKAGTSGGAIHNESTQATIINSSFQGNQAGTGNGGAINNFGETVSLINCILWNNQANGSTTTPGASSASDQSSVSFSHCLVANSGGSTGWNPTLGADLGNNLDLDPLFLLELDPATAPATGGDLNLGSGSPAIDTGLNSANATSTDLVGNPRIQNGTIDLGALESNPPGLAALWETDHDQDGNPYGVEYALGTDPNAPDPGHPANLTTPSFNPSGHATLAFGRNPAAEAHTLWILTRSTTLLPGSFAEIYRFDGPTLVETPQAAITSVPGATSISITDTAPPAGKAFYRFEAVHVP